MGCEWCVMLLALTHPPDTHSYVIYHCRYQHRTHTQHNRTRYPFARRAGMCGVAAPSHRPSTSRAMGIYECGKCNKTVWWGFRCVAGLTISQMLPHIHFRKFSNDCNKKKREEVENDAGAGHGWEEVPLWCFPSHARFFIMFNITIFGAKLLRCWPFFWYSGPGYENTCAALLCACVWCYYKAYTRGKKNKLKRASQYKAGEWNLRTMQGKKVALRAWFIFVNATSLCSGRFHIWFLWKWLFSFLHGRRVIDEPSLLPGPEILSITTDPRPDVTRINYKLKEFWIQNKKKRK